MFSKRHTPTLILVAVIIVVLVIILRGDAPTDERTHAGLHIESWQTSSGAKVLFVEAPELPMLDIRVVFNAGSARDGDTPGLARMTNLLLDHGAGEWNTDQIVERFDNIGARFSTSAMRDMAVVHLRSLIDKEWFDVALQTMQVILRSPRFEQGELDRERQRTLVALENQKESPSAQAELAFFAALYGEHPYATPTLGTSDSLKRITREQLQAFYKKYYVARNATVTIVGALDKRKARRIAEQLMDDLPGGEPASALPEVPDLQEARTIRQQHPSSQTHIWVGQPGKTRTDPDYFPLYVGNHILGGSGFGSRIMKEIREDRGLAYSSYSYFSPMQRKGPFLMGLQTRNDQAQAALEVLMQTVNKFVSEGPSEEELVHAKENITGGFALRLDSNQDITEYVAMIGFYDLPLDYLTNFNARVESVTREQIRDAFARRVRPDKMITVMVGNVDGDAGQE